MLGFIHEEAAVSNESALRQDVTAASWDYSEADTKHLTHNIHRYSGKFIPQIARRAISLISLPGELVLDPYCGSGTTLVESALLGRRSYGVDLNPLAVLIAQTKVTPIPAADLRWLHEELTQTIAPLHLDDSLPLFRALNSNAPAGADMELDPRLNDEWYSKWFQPKVLKDLVAIDHAIGRLNCAAHQNVARIAFSDILRKTSNAHSGYPNIMFDKNAPERPRPVRSFLKALDDVCDMVASLEKADARWESVRVERANATDLQLEDCSIDAIVSHPPYIASIPYAEYGALSLKWLGTDPKELDRELTGGRRHSPNVVMRFREDYGRMLQEASRVLRPGRYAFLMVGNPVVRGKPIDLAAMTLELARPANLDLVVRTERKGINRRANKMGREQLLFLRKPA